MSDYLRIFDGNVFNKKDLIVQLTGSNIPSNVSSLGSQMLIVFTTDYIESSIGFKATITKKNTSLNHLSNLCNISTPCGINEGHCHYDGQCAGTLKCGQNNCPPFIQGTNCCYDYCKQYYDVENGIIDFLFPHPVFTNDMEECSWAVHASDNHTISVELFDISVSFLSHENSCNYL